jgi:hypothetical protein
VTTNQPMRARNTHYIWNKNSFVFFCFHFASDRHLLFCI